MQSNKLRMAIRATAAMTVMGLASQAQAFNFSAGDVDASVYGYARLNASYDMNANIADAGQSGSWEKGDEDVEGHFGASAIQSRLGVKATNADGVTVNIEGDFYGTTNSRGTLRLRHAYGSYKGVLAGQTWSNYNSFVGNTSVLDFTAANGTAGYQLRTVQARYTSGPLSISAEEPVESIYDGTSTKTTMPALTARFEDSNDGLSYSAAALVKQVAYDTGTQDDSAFGFAVFGAAKFKLTDMLSVQGALNYSDGALGYLYGSGGSDAYLNGNSLETIAGYGASIGAGLSLGGGRSVNLAYGMTDVDWDDAQNDGLAVGGEDETRQNVFLNYQWTPVANTTMGVEYQYWDSETVAGDSTDNNRILFAAQYNF